jgi:hypothetical protein
MDKEIAIFVLKILFFSAVNFSLFGYQNPGSGTGSGSGK